MAGRYARGLFDRLSPAGQARALRVAGPRIDGLVTVAVVCEEADLPRLADALASVAEQGHRLLDILLIPVGTGAAGAEVHARVRAAAERLGDPRVRTRRPVAGWWPAALAGVRYARGRQLTYLRACDRLLPYAVADLLRAVRETPGATLAGGGLAQFGQEDPWLAETQAGPPGGDLRLLGRLLPTRTWRELVAPGAGGLAPAPGDHWLCSVPVARLLATTPAPARVGHPIYRFAHDHGRRAYGATPSPLGELATWPERESRLERASAGAPVAGEWHRHVATVELPRLLADAERATAEEWATLVSLARRIGPSGERVTARALVHLAAEDRRADVEALAEELGLLGGELRTELAGDRVLLRSDTVRLPDLIRRLRPAETPLIAHVRRRRPVDPAGPAGRGGPFVAEVFCRIQQVDLAGTAPVFEAVLETVLEADGERGEEIPVAATPVPEPRAERWARARFQSAAAGAVQLQLPRPGRIRLRVRVGDLVRETRFRVSPPDPAPAAGASRVTGVTLAESALVFTGPGAAGVRLAEPDVVAPPVPGTVVLRRHRFGEEQWLPPGVYPLDLGGARLGPELLDLLPVEQVGERHRVTVRRGPGGRLLAELAPPFADDEAGPYHQERLRAAYTAVATTRSRPTDPDTVYLESYAGRTATDSPAAILAELRRRRPGLRAYWGILDHSQRPAPGATPVLLRSRAHYDVLERASLVVGNTDLDEWFVHRPDQLVVQTFHGYPSKTMGRMQWESKSFTPAHVRAIRRRTVDTWDLITTPTPEMTRHYREQYDYAGPVAERGYPRDDALTPPDGPEASAARARTRRLLGIGEDTVAVLYAPTWRDQLATRPRAAEMADHLDLAEAARALGPSHVLLVRGHRFHTAGSAGSTSGSARIVDVTEHPEINDLILASDAAVLDYSSVRFDYALTGRPMVFLVPDLADYHGGTRGFLYPFTDSAPGPLVDTTAEVVELLRDVPGLRSTWADRLAAFNATYHPWQDGHATERVVDEIERLLASRRE